MTRVAPPRVYPQASRSGKPPIAAAGSTDSHRQMSFVLGTDLDLLLQGLELEGSLADAASGSRFRNQVVASALALWSRAWLSRQQALHAAEWGNYAAAVPLVRAAADYEASEIYLLRTGAAEWEEWLANGGVALAPEEHAMEFRLHAFRAAEVLAAHDILGPLYTAAMDLSMPHFGSTLLLAGNESDPSRVAITFGDRDFHFALAELVTGWLLLLGVAQLEAVHEFEGVFPVPDPVALEKWCAAARAAAGRDDRCRIEPVQRGGEKRYLVHNWRRTPGAARKRILL
jgi:hypothetical protein